MAVCAKHRLPISVVLRDKHYAALKPPENQSMPTAWLRECVGVVIDLLGAGKDLADAIRDAGAVDGPASSAQGTQKDLAALEATPSLYSYAGSQAHESPAAARRALGLGDGTPSLASARTSVGKGPVASCSKAAPAEAPEHPSPGPLGTRTAKGLRLFRCGTACAGSCPNPEDEQRPSSHKGPTEHPDRKAPSPSTAGAAKNRLNATSLDSLLDGAGPAPKRRRICSKRAVFMALDDVQFRTRGARAGSLDTASTCAGTLQGSQLGSLPSFAGLAGLDDATAEASPQPGSLQGRKRRPPAKTAKERAERKRQRDEARIAKQNQPASWKCPAPNCGWSTSGKYGSVMAHKNKHWETRHAELPKSLIFTKAEKISAISTSPLLPAHSRDWSCPLCQEGLPKLDSGRRLASIRQHCDDRHPGETPSSPCHMRQRNSTNQGSGRHQGEVHAAARAEKFPSHTLVKVCPPERLAAGERGNLYYCSQCLTPAGKNNWARQHTCEQIQQRIKDNSTLQRLRKSWWLKLKSKEPNGHCASGAQGP